MDTKTNSNETRIPIIVPDTRQVIMRENTRLMSIEHGKPAEFHAKTELARLGLRSVKPLGMMEPVDGVGGFAMYHEIGRPLQRLRGDVDPKWRLSLFSINRVLEQEDRFDELDIHFLHEAMAMARRHVGLRI